MDGTARRLRAIGALIRRDAETLARLESAQSGKPLRDARGEAARVAEMAEYWAGWCDRIEGRTVPVPSAHTVIIDAKQGGVDRHGGKPRPGLRPPPGGLLTR
jgi:acyl-CoA reductase-like NAD-dependent aldehyde dehydrogenase